jgi:hypothetical protein
MLKVGPTVNQLLRYVLYSLSFFSFIGRQSRLESLVCSGMLGSMFGALTLLQCNATTLSSILILSATGRLWRCRYALCLLGCSSNDFGESM